MVEEYPKPPKVFISYSWSSPEHILRIVSWAERLVADGVEVVLDKWYLSEGDDKYAFMEQMVADASVSKVLIFSDSEYSKKANERKGGVGTESQIISAEIYAKVKQDKFIPIVLEYDADGKACLPIYLASRIFVDFSTPERVFENYEQLIRTIFDKPLFKKPQIGAPPTYITDDKKPSIPTTQKFESFKHAVLNDKATFRGLARDYLEAVVSYLDSLRISAPPKGVELDEFVYNSILELLPLRDEMVQFFELQVKYKNDAEIYSAIFNFFDQTLKFKGPRELTGVWKESWADHLEFVTDEFFVYLIAVLIKFTRFSELRGFVDRKYLLPDNLQHGGDQLISFTVFRAPMPTLRDRNQRLKLGRISVKADLLQQRTTMKMISFNQFMQAEFILFLISLLVPPGDRAWYPSSLVYAGYSRSFELFTRATSHSYFAELAILLNVKDKADLVTRFKAGAELNRISSWTDLIWNANIDFEGLMNLDRLDTQP